MVLGDCDRAVALWSESLARWFASWGELAVGFLEDRVHDLSSVTSG